MPGPFDLAITGAGPAGTAAALTAAKAGLSVALIERATFPRHKVCGDCLNPSLWPVLESLGTAEAVRALPHAALHRVRFVNTRGRPIELGLPPGAERAVTRESFDHVQLEAALAAGVTLFSGSPLTGVSLQDTQWQLTTPEMCLTARTLIAADGRNSTTCRLLGISPPQRPGRVAIQCHAPLHPDYRGTVALELLSCGYCGIAPVDDLRMNLCLVSSPALLQQARKAIQRRFQLADDHPWHSIAPLERPDISPVPFPGCFIAGDAARVVEPFTGEGIYYALRSGQRAAEAAHRSLQNPEDGRISYQSAHRQLYRHRLWVNRLSRMAVKHRAMGDLLLAMGHRFPSILQQLTTKIINAPARHATGPGIS